MSHLSKKYQEKLSLVLLPSTLPEEVRDFDNLKEYVISGNEFKSWNNDPAFKQKGLNALYFKYTKPHKVEVEFILHGKYGVIDIVSWMPEHPQFEVRPIVLHFAPEKNETKFHFYADPFYLNRKVGYFEPRVYAGLHGIEKVKITKLLTLKANKKSKFALFLLKRAKKMLDFAEGEYDAGDYGLSLHFSRFAIEMSLKSIYPIFGIPFEWKHEIQFSHNLRQRILKIISDFPFSKLIWTCQQHIRPDRIDFYGDEVGFAPSYSFMEEDEAIIALKDARYCYEKSTLLLDSVQKES